MGSIGHKEKCRKKGGVMLVVKGRCQCVEGEAHVEWWCWLDGSHWVEVQ